MKITGHRTRTVFEHYNIADQSDTQEAGRRAEEFLAKEHGNWHKSGHKIKKSEITESR